MTRLNSEERLKNLLLKGVNERTWIATLNPDTCAFEVVTLSGRSFVYEGEDEKMATFNKLAFSETYKERRNVSKLRAYRVLKNEYELLQDEVKEVAFEDRFVGYDSIYRNVVILSNEHFEIARDKMF